MRPTKIALLLFWASFVWTVFLIYGLPIGDLDEWVLIFISKKTPWKELIVNLLSPWSNSAYWFNQVDLYDQIAHKRLMNGLVLKSAQSLFGFHFFSFYFLAKAFFFPAIVTLVFLLLRELTRSSWLALAGTAFFLFVPANYAHVLWLGDPLTIALVFVVLGVFFLSKLAENLEKGGTAPHFFTMLAGVFAAGWLGIRAKEPALILPLASFSYLLIQLLRARRERFKISLSLGVMLLILFQIVPVRYLNAPVQGFTFHWSYIGRMLFRNYGIGYEDEPVTAFFSWDQVWPVSISRTFGLLSLWALIAFALIYLIQRSRMKDPAVRFLEPPLVRISVLWVVIEIFLMGLFQPEPRYFSGTMVPLTLLSVRLIWCLTRLLERPWKQIFMAVALACWGWTTFYLNFQHVIWLRGQVGLRANRLFGTAQFLYSRLHPDEKPVLDQVARFYAPSYALDSVVRPRMEEVVYFAEHYYETWNKTKDGNLTEFGPYAQKGVKYYITYDRERFSNFTQVKLAGVISGTNKKDLFNRLVFALKRKTPQALYIFEYQL